MATQGTIFSYIPIQVTVSGVRTETLIFREFSDSSHRKDSFGWKVANGWEKKHVYIYIYYISNIDTIHACMVYLPIHLADLHGKCR